MAAVAFVIGPADWAKMILLLLAGLVALGVWLYWRFLVWRAGRELDCEERAMVAEDRRRWAAEQSWVDSDQWPLTHYDVYPNDWEMTQDLARLKAMGYDVEWQEHTEEGIAITYSLTPAYKRRGKGRRPMD